jgi:hypothetical protein
VDNSHDRLCLEVLEQGLKIEPENKDFIELRTIVQKEYDADHLVAVSAEERARFDTFFKWCTERRYKFEKIKLRYYSADNRGLVAARDIEKGDTFITIPIHDLVFIARSPLMNELIKLNAASQINGEALWAAYLCEQMSDPESKIDNIQPYLDVLPKTFAEFPQCYTDAEIEMLKGSPFVSIIEEKRSFMRKTYETICSLVPSFEKWTYQQFLAAYIASDSRRFEIPGF